MERVARAVRTSLQLAWAGFPRVAQSITMAFVAAFVLSRIWASWQAPSWSSVLPDRRDDWSRESDYPRLEHPGRQLRLLDVFPGSGSAEVEAALFTASFLELPAYEAVSYTWGGPAAPTRTMTLNGKRLRITENLWAALHALRAPRTNRTLWVDAICIDQANLEEKSQQVGLMAYVYERATRAVVWVANLPHPEWVTDAWRAQWDSSWATQQAKRDWPATAHWLHGLIDQEYWKRCWIIQEIRQARDVHVYFGSYRDHAWMPWTTLVRLGELYRAREVDVLKVDRVLRLNKLRQSKYLDGYSLHELLQEFGDCFCSLQLDRTYSFLGIADDDPGRYFLPDYTRSVFRLYTDLLSFYQSSEFHRERREIEIIHFAALVRAILSRKQSSTPGATRIVKFGEDPGSWSYQFCRKFSGSFSRSTIESLGAILNLFSEYVYTHWQNGVAEEATWEVQDPESSRDWLPFFEKGMSTAIMARGVLAGKVLKIGPTYGAYLADPNCVNRWIRDSIDAVADNSTLLRQAVALNRKLVTVLGNTGDYKIRNFVCFIDRDPGAYQKSHIFLGLDTEQNLMMGLVPRHTPDDSRLIQFWNSDAAVVVTRQDCQEESLAPKAIIGRAGIVRYSLDAQIVGWDKVVDIKPFLPSARGSVLVPMSIDVLTKLSFDTVVLPSTMGGYWYTTALLPDHWTFDY